MGLSARRAFRTGAFASAPRRVRGMTLIEILVTIFVTGVGLLGVANLQVVAKRVNYEALQRTTAAALVQDIAERMRANPSNLAAYVTDDVTALTGTSNCAASDGGCSTAELAVFDLERWRRKLVGEDQVDATTGDETGGLVSPTGCVIQADTGVYWVVVAWRGMNAAAPPDSAVPASDPSRNTCGLALGRYDDPDQDGNDDRMRRFVAVPVLASDPYLD